MTHAKEIRSPANQASHIALAILLVVTAMTTAAFLAREGRVPWTSLIFIAGTVGGVVNNFRRIQKLSLARVQTTTPMSERLVTIQIYVSPFVGGVFAIVLYGLFMSGLVRGDLFPTFQSVAEPFQGFRAFAALAMPETNGDMAKALVWAFIAGFSEGLVPNFISKVTQDAEQTNEGRHAPAATEPAE